MDIWLDTGNIKTIKSAVKTGILSGVTTNPAIIAQTKRELEDLLEDLLHYQEGPVAVQVTGEEIADMVQQGQNFYSFSNRIVVKVPVTKSGLEAIHLLSRQGIPTMGTVVFHPHQALMAAHAGASYVAPYVSKIEQAGGDPWLTLKTMLQVFQNYRLKTKILGASIGSIDQVIKCATTGIYGITVKDALFEELIADQPLTTEAMKAFNQCKGNLSPAAV